MNYQFKTNHFNYNLTNQTKNNSNIGLKNLAFKLSQLSDLALLKFVLDHGDAQSMDTMVPNRRFRAYQIAKHCYKIRKISNKQRIALCNVYMYSKYQIKYEELLN